MAMGKHKRRSLWKKALLWGLSGFLAMHMVFSAFSVSVSADPEGTEEAVVPADIAAFPVSYHERLLALKAQHPTWQFAPIDTGLDWETALRKEMQDGKSLVHKSLPNCMKEGAYDQGNWFYASKEALAYYMDPRNGLTEERIFQFEQLTYNEQYHTLEALEQFLANTFMRADQNAPGTVMTYPYIIYMIGKEDNRRVSPFHLAARILQEQGQGNSPLISGTYPGYEGIYNYFNIGATGNTDEEVIINGLEYAKKNWQPGVYYAIMGGADYITGKYVRKGQYTVYLEKFNVNPEASYATYSHQYMQNVSAPTTEAKSILKQYQAVDVLESPFVFHIPVYRNMPVAPCAMPSVSTNIVLNIPTDMSRTKVTVDGTEYEGTNYYDYNSHNRRLVVTLPDGNAKKAVIESFDGEGRVVNGLYWDLSYQGTYYEVTIGTKPEEPQMGDEDEEPTTDEGEEEKDSFVIDEKAFPDQRFREYVASNIDLDKDGLLSDEERAVVVEISCPNSKISSLAGMECFDNLEILNCTENDITELNLYAFPKLSILKCNGNELEYLDLRATEQLLNLVTDIETEVTVKDENVLEYFNPGKMASLIVDESVCLITEAGQVKWHDMYRMYNPNSGEHFYTKREEERDYLIHAGWNYEGIAWNAPQTSNIPVYRLYNPNAGDHHYTVNADERDMLVLVGWLYEGIGWYSADTNQIPLYRLYNPNAECGTHHYTTNEEERDYLIELGWRSEGIGWYGCEKKVE